MYVIFDLDGTLARLDHRLHYVRNLSNDPDFKPNWDAFHHACVYDEPIREMIFINQAVALLNPHTTKIEIWSGRSDMVRPQTEKWLEEHGIHYDVLFMRSAGDFTPDDELKESWLHSPFTGRPDIVFDNRKRVVDMWRRNGIRCVQVAPGEF